MTIRRAKRDDVTAMADLIVRSKKLNNEFDPLFAVVSDVRQKAEKYLVSTVDEKERLLLVAVHGEKVVGIVRGELRERLFYEPHLSGYVTDFYILPEFRRKAVGHEMIQRASKELKEMGAQIIVGEVPSQNEIANRFYVKRGFRGLTNLLAKKP